MRRTLRHVHGEPLRLHLRCEQLPKEGWINVDLYPPPGTFYADLRNPLELGDGVASHIYCEHVLEHLDWDDALAFLRECFRVLGPAGTLRLIMPDAEKYMRAYAAGDRTYFSTFEHLGNAVRPLRMKVEGVNQMFRMGGHHRFACDFEMLHHHLKATGFDLVERSSYRDVAERFRIDGTDTWHEQESLYVNAAKPGTARAHEAG